MGFAGRCHREERTGEAGESHAGRLYRTEAASSQYFSR
jgi:hypothetical protein